MQGNYLADMWVGTTPIFNRQARVSSIWNCKTGYFTRAICTKCKRLNYAKRLQTSAAKIALVQNLAHGLVLNVS